MLKKRAAANNILAICDSPVLKFWGRMCYKMMRCPIYRKGKLYDD